jgi:hypothetical protein
VPQPLPVGGAQSFSIARDGTIVAHASSSAGTRLTRFSRAGLRLGTVAGQDAHTGTTLSADARRVAVTKAAADRWDAWEVGLSTDAVSRLTTDADVRAARDAIWSPDGSRLAFTAPRFTQSTPGTLASVCVRDVSTGGQDLVASLPDGHLHLDGWTPDGRSLVVRTPGEVVYMVTIGVDRAPRPLHKSSFTIAQSAVSPDGRWIAYNSNESGTWEVYVVRFPEFTSRRLVSSAGGVQPHWRADGRELFYLAPDSSMMSVPISTGDELTVQRAVRLFGTDIDPSPEFNMYGVTPDGQRFLALDRVGGNRETLMVLLNWLTPENLERH